MSEYSRALFVSRAFYNYLQARSCLDVDQDGVRVKTHIYADFKNGRLEDGATTPRYSTLLYFLKMSGIVTLKKNGVVRFKSGRSVFDAESLVDSSGAERLLHIRSRKKNAVMSAYANANAQSLSLEITPAPPTIASECGNRKYFFRAIDNHSRTSTDMTIKMKNANASQVRIFSCQLLSYGNLSMSRISGSLALRKGEECSYRITCQSDANEMNLCLTDLILGFKTDQSDTTTVCRYTVIFDKEQLVKDTQPKPKAPPVVTQVRRRNLIGGIRPPRSGTDRLKKKVKLDEYPVAASVKNALIAGAFSEEYYRDDYKQMRKLAEGELSLHIHAKKFHFLLQLEEMQGNYDILRYSMSGVSFTKHGRLMYLKVDGLAERRPSVLRGDRVLVTCHRDSNNPDSHNEFEGYVHTVELDQIGVGFSHKLFNKATTSDKYDVRFTFNRLPIRVYHRAVDLRVSSQVIFPTKCATLYRDINIKKSEFKNKLVHANLEQRQAVLNIVQGKTEPVPYIVFGPPGTGKTVTLVEGICQVIAKYEGCAILVCAPSNSACDHLTKLILQYQRSDSMFRMHAASRMWKDVPDEIRTVSNYRDGDFYLPTKKEFENFEIVICTLVTAGRIASAGFEKDFFTHVFVDEAGQATEPECMTAISGILSKTGQLVLAGDPMQLGPVVSSAIAKRYGLGVSYLERLMADFQIYCRDSETLKYDSCYITKLLKNYRSHEAILKVSNECFYDNELLYAVSACASMELVCKWSHLPRLGFPVIFEGVGGEDSRESNSPSFFNANEMSVLIQYVEKTINLGFSGKSIGIITPYRKQVEKIRQRVRGRDIKVGTVEEFQGQERDVVIISTVRSSLDYLSFDIGHNLGFLSDPKRFNVAVTRARMLLIVVGNPNILALDYYWRTFLEYCIAENAYRGIAYQSPDARKCEMESVMDAMQELTI